MPEVLRTVRATALEAIPGLVHGFERRSAGIAGESRENSRGRVVAAVREAGRLFLLRQVHGCAVVTAPFDGAPAADAVIVSEPGQLGGVETADCMPVLIVDPEARLAAAVHAGWRGTRAQVTRKAVCALVARGAVADRLHAALGPSVGVCCYEVGEEVADAFRGVRGGVRRDGPRCSVDLRRINEQQLMETGVAGDRIHHIDECTLCRSDDYHSFRRDGAAAGRMINYVGWRE